MGVRARFIAFYLPQFHPIPENDELWGKGFTEWTNVAKAKPLFRGHYQPHLPADLGYYDLRVPEVREAQAEMARNAGVEAFCYYHYWFAGKRLLERPFNEVVACGKPDFPFCLCWANQSWSGIWHGFPNRISVNQSYPGPADNRRHFLALLDAFLDKRYLRIDSRPIFLIYRPLGFPNLTNFIQQWQELAVQNGLPGIHFIAHLYPSESAWDFRSRGFDSCTVVGTFQGFMARGNLVASRALADPGTFGDVLFHSFWRRYRLALGQFAQVRLYRHALSYMLEGCSGESNVHPTVTPNWDSTPRSHTRGYVLHDSTPELFRAHLRDALNIIKSHPIERRLIFLKSWNEWAEGNYVEPDQRFGHDYLTVIREEVSAARDRVPAFDWSESQASNLLTRHQPNVDPVKLVGASKVARNITERKRAERVQAEQTRLLDLNSDAIMVRDAADRVRYWNTAASELYGYTREEALGRVTHELLRTQFPEPLETINAQLQCNERWTGKLVHKKKDGTQIAVLSRWVLDRDVDRKQWSVLETNSDVTERK
jgi:PAS domain S-box-containing protein